MDMFHYKDLAHDVLLTTSIEKFSNVLRATASLGKPYTKACMEHFKHINMLELHNGSYENMMRLKCDIDSLLASVSFKGSALCYINYINSFFNDMRQLALTNIDKIYFNDAVKQSHLRQASYARDIGLFSSRTAKNILEFCSGPGVFSLLAYSMGYNVISTDIGGTSQQESYGMGAKNFIREHFVCDNVFDYSITKLSDICSIKWFENTAPIVLAVSATYFDVGRNKNSDPKSTDLKKSVFEAVHFLKPLLLYLCEVHGILSMRHVTIFGGYDIYLRQELSNMLKAMIENNYNVQVLFCGVEPVIGRWCENDMFNFGILVQC